MPQGDVNKINFEKPLEIKAYQYDIVCNGVELSSGAIRNHIPDLMYKLFSVVGYNKNDVNKKFSGMINALSYGAPPHGGIAPGVDRIIMLLAGKKEYTRSNFISYESKCPRFNDGRTFTGR